MNRNELAEKMLQFRTAPNLATIQHGRHGMLERMPVELLEGLANTLDASNHGKVRLGSRSLNAALHKSWIARIGSCDCRCAEKSRT